MQRGSANLAFQQIRTLYTLGTLSGLTDAQLLELFLTRGGDDAEDAFAALVHRHGPMVLGVCRRMLPGSHDAEDSFQATFLIFRGRPGCLDRAAAATGELAVRSRGPDGKASECRACATAARRKGG